MKAEEWAGKSREETLDVLGVGAESGLSQREAEKRLALFGPNSLREYPKKSLLWAFFEQMKDFMVLVLVAAAVISGWMGEWADTLTIMIIVVVNACLGLVQERRAEQSLENLKKMSAPETFVLRDGVSQKIPSRDLARGDIVLLESGAIVPADLRLLESLRMEVNEAALTGESLPVRKNSELIQTGKLAVADQSNMAFMGTEITAGKGKGAVVAVGMDTEFGKIADSLQTAGSQMTPLQRRLAQLGRWLVAGCVGIVSLVVVIGWASGIPFHQMFLTGVSLAVAAIPEGLPAIVTIALAIGVQRMTKRNAIIRSLPAVETLGCTTVICADKTGTLTQNAMIVRQMSLSGETVFFEGNGYDPKGEVRYPEESGWREKNKKGLEQALRAASLCNNAELLKDEIPIKGLFRSRQPNWRIIGDPTEGALLVAAMKAGVWRENLKLTRVDEIPFDPERKRMSVLYQDEAGKQRTVYAKGAPDALLECCDRVWRDGTEAALTARLKREILRANDDLAANGFRVLGLAARTMPAAERARAGKGETGGKGRFAAGTAVALGAGKKAETAAETEMTPEDVERGMVFLGLAGMTDPPREGVRQAVSTCRHAGIQVVMMTGDHAKTAEATAKNLGILRNASDELCTGAELDAMDDSALRRRVSRIRVFARVSPRHKLRIVRCLKDMGHVAAMTGDGVNDAPAVKEADIGISMGFSGTDVTRDASDLILSDDNFSTILAAVEEGRIIYENIRRFIQYLLAGNIGEVLLMFAATLAGVPLPLLPLQILWVNLVTDGLPAMALGVEKGDDLVLLRPPRNPEESVFARGMGAVVILNGILIAAVCMGVYIFGFLYFRSLETARTMTFCALVISQLLYALECGSRRNGWLTAAVAGSLLMQLSVVYIPFFQTYFKTVALPVLAWNGILIPLLLCTLLRAGLKAAKTARAPLL
ncbi:MAG: cation-translocating P-type ATPase [Peptococcaceae bacterium]|jgi:Ca2+-transporting ATPase|nr:cation-translocating P-type ATPase [Peptococcaceae bacterium]